MTTEILTGKSSHQKEAFLLCPWPELVSPVLPAVTAKRALYFWIKEWLSILQLLAMPMCSRGGGTKQHPLCCLRCVLAQ